MCYCYYVHFIYSMWNSFFHCPFKWTFLSNFYGIFDFCRNAIQFSLFFAPKFPIKILYYSLFIYYLEMHVWMKQENLFLEKIVLFVIHFLPHIHWMHASTQSTFACELFKCDQMVNSLSGWHWTERVEWVERWKKKTLWKCSLSLTFVYLLSP